jgi:hypothetical protein
MKIHRIEFWLCLIISYFVPAVSANCGENDFYKQKPLSNIGVSENVFRAALENSTVPDGAGQEISIEICGVKNIKDLLQQNAVEIFQKKNYKITEKKLEIPVIQINLEKIDITLSVSDKIKKNIDRKSEISVSLIIDEKNGNKKVYTGNGQSTDTFNKEYLNAIYAPNEDIMVMNFAESRVKVVKPIVISVSMTILVWFLYSYRG